MKEILTSFSLLQEVRYSNSLKSYEINLRGVKIIKVSFVSSNQYVNQTLLVSLRNSMICSPSKWWTLVERKENEYKCEETNNETNWRECKVRLFGWSKRK